MLTGLKLISKFHPSLSWNDPDSATQKKRKREQDQNSKKPEAVT